MILAEQHDVSADPFALILTHFPLASDLNGQTLDITEAEEAALDKEFGLTWPMHLAAVLTHNYRTRGESVDGFGVEITFPHKKGCRVTFTIEQDPRPH